MSSFLNNPQLRFVLFGGKGGSGKTTSAAASALHFARLWPARRVLLVSTDPAHSLSDSLDCAVGGEPTLVAGTHNLYALALDAKALLQQFKERYGHIIALIADRGTYLDKEDIAGFLELSLPGIDEVTAFLELMDLMNAGAYDLVILDTAPAGHTIRLLALPGQMEQWIRIMDMMMEKHRFMCMTFGGRYVPDAPDHFLQALWNDVQGMRELFRNEVTTEFVPVVNAEEMSILETEALMVALSEGAFPVHSVILNRVMDATLVGMDCPFCQARMREQAPKRTEIEARFADFNLVTMPQFAHEVRGLPALTDYAELLFRAPSRTAASEPVEESVAGGQLVAYLDTVTNDFADLFAPELQFVLFGGKGGVGKTTMAATTALELAQRNPEGKTLIFSTDPTHSLADCLACDIGDQPVAVPGAPGLYAMQINASERLDELKQMYMEEINEVFDRFMGGGTMGVAFDREVMMELVSLIPPGVDEIIALIAMIELLEDGSFTRFVLDTAPTGHMLRLLEMPQLAMEWFRTLFRLLLKYQGASALAKTTELLLQTSRGVKKVQALLTDPAHSTFVAVTIPEAMGVLETERFLASLAALHIPCHHLLVNLVAPATQCPFCRSRRDEQRKYIEGLRAKFPGYIVSEAPLFPKDVRGIADLQAMGTALFA